MVLRAYCSFGFQKRMKILIAGLKKDKLTFPRHILYNAQIQGIFC
jgi:hypothetical protein